MRHTLPRCRRVCLCTGTDPMLVVAAHVMQAPNDQRESVPTLDKISALPHVLGTVDALLADTGYFSAANMGACEAHKIVPTVAMNQDIHSLAISRGKTGSMSSKQVPATPALNRYPRSVQVGEFEVATGGGIWVAIRDGKCQGGEMGAIV